MCNLYIFQILIEEAARLVAETKAKAEEQA